MTSTSQLSTKHLLGIKQISRDDILTIFKAAADFKEVINRPYQKVPSLRDVTVVNLFLKILPVPAFLFELAERRLSADVLNFTASASSVSKGETLLDTVNNIPAMKVDMVVMRHPAPGAHVFLSNHIDANIINAGDGTHEHPTQALLDAFSMTEVIGHLKVKTSLIVGDILHSRVAFEQHLRSSQAGPVAVCGPPTLIPKYLGTLGVKVMYNILEALQWCDVANILRIQLERQDIKYIPSLREYALYYG